MKLLLTSAGIKNDSIRNALVESLGKPIVPRQVNSPASAHNLAAF